METSDDPVLRWLRAASAAHPDLGPLDAYYSFVAERLEAIVSSSDPAARAADVVLAAACAGGDVRALVKLETELEAPLPPLLARIGVKPEDRAEIVQRVRVALFVPTEGAAPGIAAYRGRGDLAAYVRAVAGKLALKHQTRRPPDAPGGERLERVLAAEPGRAVDPAKAEAAAVMKTALSEALGALPSAQRLLLRQHYVDGVSASDLARVHQVHRATTTRWIEEARAELVRHLRTALESQGIARHEIDELVGVAASQIELSLSRVFGSPG